MGRWGVGGAWIVGDSPFPENFPPPVLLTKGVLVLSTPHSTLTFCPLPRSRLACGGVLCVLFIEAVRCVPSTVSLLCTLLLFWVPLFLSGVLITSHLPSHSTLTSIWSRAASSRYNVRAHRVTKVRSFSTCRVIVRVQFIPA